MGDAGGKASTPSAAAYLGPGQHKGQLESRMGSGVSHLRCLCLVWSLPIVVFNEVTTFERLY